MRLVTVAHGTRHTAGNAVAVEITDAASARLGMSGVTSYLELASPLFSQVMSGGEPSVVVPLLLSTGHHVRHDLKGLRALGPHPLLADAQASRLLDAGARHGQPVVMVASGSRDPRTSIELERAAEHLANVWGARVRLATLSGVGPSVEQVIQPEDAVSPYLLADGHFAHRCRTASARATVVADVLGAHPAVVDLVVARALESLLAHDSVPGRGARL